MVGIYILKNIASSPNPSILAASNISFGKDFVFCLKKKIKNAVDILGNITAKYEFNPIKLNGVPFNDPKNL